MLNLFPTLYVDVLRTLRDVLQTDQVRYSEQGFLPGFSIIDGVGHKPLRACIGRFSSTVSWVAAQYLSRTSMGDFHTDGQASLLGLPDYRYGMPQITFLLPILLPPQGHGLHLSEATSDVPPERAIRSRRAYVRYVAGTMLIFNGDHWHRSSAVPICADGWRRIMFTGHAVLVNGTWEVYY